MTRVKTAARETIVKRLPLISTAFSLSLRQDSGWSDMSAFSGETTTTSGLDGRIFTFRATSTAVW